jgi:hypothetical protein
MAGLGMPADYALGAASWRAREWLGWNPTLDEEPPLTSLSTTATPATT